MQDHWGCLERVTGDLDRESESGWGCREVKEGVIQSGVCKAQTLRETRQSEVLKDRTESWGNQFDQQPYRRESRESREDTRLE